MSEQVTLEFATKGIRRVLRQMDKVEDQFGDLDRAVQAARGAMRGLRTAMVAGTAAAGTITAGMAALAREATEAGSQLEQAGIKLDSLFGSTEEGQRALAGLRDVARSLPFTFSEITEVSPTLAVISDDADQLTTRLAQAAEISARFGISLQETAGNMVRFFTAGASAADLFRERGVLQELGVVAGEETTLQESKKLWQNFFQDIEESGSSALGRLADSFEGRLSMVQDAWFTFLSGLADAGVMDAAKRALTEIRDILRDFTDSGRMEDFADAFTNALANMVGALQAFVNTAAAATRRLRDGPIGRMLGFDPSDREQKRFAQFQLGRLEEIEEEMLGDRRETVGLASQIVELPPGAGLDAVQQRISELESLVDEMGRETSKSVDFLGLFNDAVDRIQRSLRGGGAGGAGLTPPDLTGDTASGFSPISFTGMAQIAQMKAGDTSEIASMEDGAVTILPEKLREDAKLIQDTTQKTFNLIKDEGSSAFESIAGVAVSSMGSAVQAAVTGFNNIAHVVVNSVQSILQALSSSMEGGLFGLGSLGVPIIGAVGGILSAVVSGGGDNQPQDVNIVDQNMSEPLDTRDREARGPESVIIQVLDSSTGEKMDEIEYQLRRRERRDATRRLPPGTSLGFAGV